MFGSFADNLKFPVFDDLTNRIHEEFSVTEINV